MIRLTTLIIGLLLVTSLSGCNASADVGNAVENVLNEVGEAYTNVTTSINNIKEWFTTKVNQVDQAATNVQEAADSLGNAVNSIKDVAGIDNIETTPQADATPNTTE